MVSAEVAAQIAAVVSRNWAHAHGIDVDLRP